MRLFIHLDGGDKGTPIETANAIIRNYIDSAACFDNRPGVDDIDRAQEELAEIAEHILTYVKYNRKPCITFLDEKVELREE